MRIIAGSLKGRRLATPPVADARVRPTSDRAREALFSILQRWPQGALLDLFSGTGAVALEAYSRGYAPVIAVEQGEPGWTCLLANAKGTEIQTLRSDALMCSPGAFKHQSVIFADPPYSHSLQAWEALASRLRQWISPDGILVWETDSRSDLPLLEGWSLDSVRDYGRVRFHLLRPRE